MRHWESGEVLRMISTGEDHARMEHERKMENAESATLYVVKQLSEMKDDEDGFTFFLDTLYALGLDVVNMTHPKYARQEERRVRMAMRVRARKKLSYEAAELLVKEVNGYAKA